MSKATLISEVLSNIVLASRPTPRNRTSGKYTCSISELFTTLEADGFRVVAGDLGENVTTRGIDLLSLLVGSLLTLGTDASVVVTGLRNPCSQIDDFQMGLLKKVSFRGPDGALVRIVGIMAIVKSSGRVDFGARKRVFRRIHHGWCVVVALGG